jgi:peptide/nickel transport system permease protein
MKRQNKFNYGLKNFFKAAWAFLKKIWQNPQGRTGIIMIACLGVIAVLAPVIAPYNPYDVALRDDKGLAPSAQHLLGTSITTGQDVFSMLLYGTRVSLCIGLITGLAIALLGSVLGVVAGYAGNIADIVIMRVVDIMLVIPTLPLTILITNVFGKSYFVIVMVFVILGWPGLARTVRSQVLQIKNNDYVKAAELSGAGRGYIMFRHILPGVSHLVVMSTALTCAGIMIAEAGLSFLGLGNPTTISWGKMLADAQSGGSVLFGQWWTIIAPGIGIFLAVFSFMRVGLAVEEILNPNVRRQGSIKKLWKHMNGRYLDEVFGSMEEGRE